LWGVTAFLTSHQENEKGYVEVIFKKKRYSVLSQFMHWFMVGTGIIYFKKRYGSLLIRDKRNQSIGIVIVDSIRVIIDVIPIYPIRIIFGGQAESITVGIL